MAILHKLQENVQNINWGSSILRQVTVQHAAVICSDDHLCRNNSIKILEYIISLGMGRTLVLLWHHYGLSSIMAIFFQKVVLKL